MVAAMPQNDPFAMIRAFTQPRRNQLAGLASGLLSGNDWGPGMAAGFARAAEGRQADDAYAVAEEQKAKSAEQLQKTISYLRTQPGGETWADAVESGMADPKDAFKGWYEESKGAGAAEPMEINGQLVDPKTGKVLGDYRTPETASGDAYTLGPGQARYDAQGNVIAKGPEKPAGSLSPTAQKELFEAEDASTAGQYVLSALDEAINLSTSAYEGPGADIRGDTTGIFGNEEGQATQRLKNVTTELALTQLRTVFGASPTEGERQILLELQGSVNQPRAVRDAIYKRAKAAAERRIEDNKRKAAGLRSGDYFEPGYGSDGNSGDGWTVIGAE